MERIGLQDIAEVLVGKNGLSRKEANRFVNEMFALIQEKVEQGESLKIRGLGTFKIVNVEPRESVSVRTGERVVIEGHSKVSLTPDTVMKELVNKPFSQFETVVLNDGVEFDDVKEQDEDAEDDDAPVADEVVQSPEPQTEPKVEPEVEPVVEPVVEPQIELVVEPQIEPHVEPQIEPEVKPELEPEVEPQIEPQVETPKTIHIQEPEPIYVRHADYVPNDDDDRKKSYLYVLMTLGVLVLMAMSGIAGYYYGRNQVMSAMLLNDSTMAKVMQNAMLLNEYEGMTTNAKPKKVQQQAEPVEKPDSAKQTLPEAKPAEQPKSEAPKAVAPVEPKKVAAPVKSEKDLLAEKYDAMDERVRLGAYRIVGTEKEVKVQEGQTFYSICRAYLGPGMECYVEVYNELPKGQKLKAGQIIRIPKLELKKRKK